jgi:translation initiation factor 1 (eIF-1/SUI1)
MVITKEINGTAEYKIETQRSKPPLWVRCIQGSINDIRKELSVLVEIKRDNRRVQNIKRIRLLKKYNIEKEDLNRLIEELKQKFQLKRNNYIYTGKEKIRITKISCLGKTVRNFITSLGRQMAL